MIALARLNAGFAQSSSAQSRAIRKILVAVLFLAASTAFAKKNTETLAEVSFKNKEINHRYVLLKEGKKPVFKLVFYKLAHLSGDELLISARGRIPVTNFLSVLLRVSVAGISNAF